jgi:excisionase family DNA binding protein
MEGPEVVQGHKPDTVPVQVAVAAAPLVLNALEVAVLLKIGKSTFLRLHSAGKVPQPVRFGRSVRWRRAELEAWVAAGAPSRDKWARLQKI